MMYMLPYIPYNKRAIHKIVPTVIEQKRQITVRFDILSVYNDPVFQINSVFIFPVLGHHWHTHYKVILIYKHGVMVTQ